MFLLVISVFVMIGFIEMAPLVKARQLKELILYSFIFTAAFVVSLLLSLNMKLPSPAKPMNDFIEAALKFFSS